MLVDPLAARRLISSFHCHNDIVFVFVLLAPAGITPIGFTHRSAKRCSYSDAECKGKRFFDNFQIFLKIFFIIETALRTFAFVKCYLHRSGCKGKAFFDNFQIFLKDFFEKLFLRSLLFRSISFIKAAAK